MALSKIEDIITKVGDIINNIQFFLWIIGAFVTCIAILKLIFYVKLKKYNKASKNNIKNSKRNKKYIGEIYVESDNTTEKLIEVFNNLHSYVEDTHEIKLI